MPVSADGVLVRPGAALIVGLATPTGVPFATRGWGIGADPGDGSAIRLLLDGDDRVLDAVLALLGEPDGLAIAVTAADVPNLESVQLNGRVLRLEAPTEHDLTVHHRYRETFTDAIVETDGVARALLERIVPRTLLTCVLEARDAFDQTPGPGAGAALPRHPA